MRQSRQKDQFPPEIHERIRFLWSKSNISQKEFAEKLDIAQSHLSGVMTNRNPSRRLLFSIAELTNANMDWLESGVGEPFKPKQEESETPELAKVLTETHSLFHAIPDDVGRYETAAMILRVISEQKAKYRKEQEAAKPVETQEVPASPVSKEPAAKKSRQVKKK